ncbi:MAG: hypothetical protein WCF07_04720 [Nitrososphaeraceae archaeon]
MRNSKYFGLIAVAAVAVMLIGATAFATDSAFAGGKKKYEKNHALSQANDCGNGKLPMSVYCQNLAAQIQGDGNAMNIIGAQG